MTVIRWNPLREIDDLFARAGHFPATVRSLAPAQRNVAPPAQFTPVVDVLETDGAYVIELELPGFAAEDVAVSVHEGVLAIAGGTPVTPTSEATETAEVDDVEAPAAPERRVLRRERRRGAFERRFRLPKDADVDAIEASASNGVVTVSIARQVAPERRAIEVKVA